MGFPILVAVFDIHCLCYELRHCLSGKNSKTSASALKNLKIKLWLYKSTLLSQSVYGLTSSLCHGIKDLETSSKDCQM